MSEEEVSIFNLYSPTDYRYSVKALEPYLTEEAFIKYQAQVECALAKTLANRGFCSQKIAKEITKAASQVTAKEVYREENRVKHDIRALANVIRAKVGKEAKSFVHLTATSNDVKDTANALRYRDATEKVILPDMVALEKILMELAKKEKETIQVGRTHGQHAEPITLGFAIAQYVNRWGTRVLKLKEAFGNLTGKFAGAVGAYNASNLLFNDPESFEEELLGSLGLKPAEISTQIVPPEPMTDYIHSVVSAFGVLANFARDMRNLQRSEIGEVGELFGEKQVGSSTMPQKRNPINFENVESTWKKFMPQMVTIYMDQISEHQRDLTNSCSQRYTPELLVAFDSAVRKMTRGSVRLQVDRDNLQKNFELNKDKMVAEPLYVLLAFHGHPDAHEQVRELTVKSYQTGKPLTEIIQKEGALKPYLKKLTRSQLEILSNPSNYSGIAAKKTEKIIALWERRLKNAGLWK